MTPNGAAADPLLQVEPLGVYAIVASHLVRVLKRSR